MMIEQKRAEFEAWLYLGQTEYDPDDLNKREVELARLAYQAGSLDKLQGREDAIDMEVVAEQLRDMASSAYETAMTFGVSRDSFERLAHQVFDHARRIEGEAKP